MDIYCVRLSRRAARKHADPAIVPYRALIGVITTPDGVVGALCQMVTGTYIQIVDRLEVRALNAEVVEAALAAARAAGQKIGK